MPLSLAQRTIAQDPRRFRVAVCGRRFGKTFLARNQIARFASRPNQLVYFVTGSYRMAKNIMWKALKRKLIEIRWVSRVHESELSLTLVNNSVIQLKGADNYDSLRGVGLNFLVMDECADIESAAWYEVLRPMLADTGGHALFLGTPRGFNWFKDLYDRKDTDPLNWAGFQYTTIDGGNVSEQEIEQARQDLDPRTFSQEFLASFENFTGRVAYAFDRTTHVIECKNKVQDHRELIIGTDFNTNPITSVIYVQEGEILYAVDEIRIPNSNTGELAAEIQSRYAGKRIKIFPDASGLARKTSGGGQTDISILQNAGFEVKVNRSNPAVRDRINSMNSRLINEQGQIRIFFDPSLKYTIQSMERYIYKQDTQQPDKGVWDHMFDSASYPVSYLYPIRRNLETSLPRRLTVATL